MPALPFHVEIFTELFEEDGLLLMAKGLGLRKILLKFLKLHCHPRNLVFVLNANNEEVALLDALQANGVSFDRLPKVVDNSFTSTERQQLYARGGCFFVTSRILILDFLNKRVPSSKVSGFLVNQAHRVSETSTEAFILRVYREENESGFIKAFTDEPSSLLSGFHKVEKVLASLHVRKLYLWPRFQASIMDSLNHPEYQVCGCVLCVRSECTSFMPCLLF
jgi:DNA excision repair protein ERCC-4